MAESIYRQGNSTVNDAVIPNTSKDESVNIPREDPVVAVIVIDSNNKVLVLRSTGPI